MVETEEKLETIEVVKRNGKKVEFDGTKVAMAIKKGFDSVLLDSEENEKKYNTKDIQKVYQAVIKKIAKDYLPLGKIKIEEIILFFNIKDHELVRMVLAIREVKYLYFRY